MLTIQNVTEFVAYAVQETGLNHSQIREIVQSTERELHRYNIAKYRPIPAFRKTVLIKGNLVAVDVCRWFFVNMLNFYIANEIPIPENVAVYVPEVLRPMVVSKLRKYQKYDFRVTEQRIDESVCFALETVYNTVEETNFLIPKKVEFVNGKILINGIRVNGGPDSMQNLESARLAGDWVCLYKRKDSKMPFLSSMPRLNIVRASLSIACRKFVELSIGRSVSQSNSTFEVTDSEDRLLNLIAKREKTPFPIGEFIHDEKTSIVYRAIVYAESLGVSIPEQVKAANEFSGVRISERHFFRLQRKAHKAAQKFYNRTVIHD